MGLDFIIDHCEHRFLATQQERLAYFTQQRGIETGALPIRSYRSHEAVTTHYFPESFPLFLDQENAEAVSFVYVDDSQLSGDAFKSYLHSYRELFQALKSLNLIFLTQVPARFEMAQRAVERSAARDRERPDDSVDLNRLLAHFPHRLLYEKRVTRSLNTAEITRLQHDLHELVGPRIDRLYAVWRESGDEELRTEWTAQNRAAAPADIKLTPCVLECDYDLFGTLQAEV